MAGTYSHGYCDEMVDLLARRTAASDAAFFTPALRPGMRLLDCGCGPGALTAGLARAVAPGGEVVGVDVDPGQVEIARRHAKDLGLANLRFEVADLRSLPFPDESFDAVFAHTVLQHLADPERGLAEMHRVLRAPGVLGVREEDWGGTFFHPTSPVLERSMAVVLDDWRATGGDPFLPRRYRELLGRVGFTHIRTSATAVTRDLEEAQRWSELCAAYLLAPATKARVLEAGLADAQTLEDIRVAWLSWGRDASAFWSFTFCEAVALKTA